MSQGFENLLNSFFRLFWSFHDKKNSMLFSHNFVCCFFFFQKNSKKKNKKMRFKNGNSSSPKLDLFLNWTQTKVKRQKKNSFWKTKSRKLLKIAFPEHKNELFHQTKQSSAKKKKQNLSKKLYWIKKSWLNSHFVLRRESKHCFCKISSNTF